MNDNVKNVEKETMEWKRKHTLCHSLMFKLIKEKKTIIFIEATEEMLA